MKIAIVSDTHLSARNDLQVLLDKQDTFWKDYFFPELKSRNIKKIYHLGDFFDKRQFVTVKSMDYLNRFIGYLEEYDCTMDLIVGNHDILYRNTLDYNSPKYMFASTNRVNVLEEPTEIGNILMVPWITKENFDATFKVINETKCLYCFGHFEISGFELHKGQTHEGGLKPEVFSKFHKVLSGHFHTRSKSQNIEYIGSPFEITWNDFNDARGYHIFDTDSGELEFIEYKNNLFYKVEYFNGSLNWAPEVPTSLENTFIKLVVKQKSSYVEYDNFLKGLYSQNPSDIQIFDTIESTNIESINEETESLSNLEIITKKINILDLHHTQRDYLIKYMSSLYQESIKGITL